MTVPATAIHNNPFLGESGREKEIAILPSSVNSGDSPREDPMDLSPSAPAAEMGPPVHSSPEMDQGNSNHSLGPGPTDSGNGVTTGPHQGLSAAAAASTPQPKVVQAAFIHKLYNMLEDSSIQHLISWSANNESFVMSPSNEFSKVLAQYFKHTNVSSFVRQLNMYGFHKVSDVFHTGSPESTLWEFKHGNGNFKKGDLMGLREIKRRASKHALIHRESFPSSHKANVSQPGTPAEPAMDPTESRLASLEHSLYDVHSRLSRTEDSYASLGSKYQAVMEGLIRCHQWNKDLCHFVMTVVPDPESPVRKDISMMQQEITRQTEMLRAHEEPPDMFLPGRPTYFSHPTVEQPVSPRQTAQDDPRRPGFLAAPRQSFFRPPVPAHLAVSPRRYGSVGHSGHSPGSLRPQAPPPPPVQHPLASVTSPTMNLGRRHTSADIRVHGWQAPPAGGSPFASGHSSTQWPSSPSRTPTAVGESSQQVRDVLAQYEINKPRRPSQGSRQPTPPLTYDTTPSTTSAESGWSLAGLGGGGSRFNHAKASDISAPPTRRSSMASNVHSLLNPADTAERPMEDDNSMDDRKRKRVQ
ncbi:MAG: hypoxanthine-guanine phosphoribosyltransferase [Chaenotheca gracillima]|nr:MAG: hypoxanthine-guanine phosphoribosyltransferase [Chaenotheca gracillima]